MKKNFISVIVLLLLFSCGKKKGPLKELEKEKTVRNNTSKNIVKNMIITPLQIDPQQLRFWALREFWAHASECISLGMPFQYPPRPEKRACQGSSATEKYSRQLVLEGPSLFF